MTMANSGETVLLKNAGDFVLGAELQLQGEIVKPEVPSERPILKSAAGHNVVMLGTGSRLEGVKLSITGLPHGATFALNAQVSSSADRLEIVTDGSGALLKEGAVLSNSFVTSTVSFGSGIVTGTGPTPALPETAIVQNVTAIATGLNSRGLAAFGTFGDVQTVTVCNSILRGLAFDLLAEDAPPDTNIDVNVTNSNYITSSDDPPEAVINDLGGRQTSAPLFVNALAGDFHQQAGSPTIDAGTIAGITATDYDGEARAQGLAPDIGADEFPAATPTPAVPATPATPAKRKCKKGFRLKTVKTKSGKKKKKCVRRKRRRR